MASPYRCLPELEDSVLAPGCPDQLMGRTGLRELQSVDAQEPADSWVALQILTLHAYPDMSFGFSYELQRTHYVPGIVLRALIPIFIPTTAL